MSSVGSGILLCGVIDPSPISYPEHCVTPHMTIILCHASMLLDYSQRTNQNSGIFMAAKGV